jgi:hypothetical protein
MSGSVECPRFILSQSGVADLLVITTKKKPCNTRYEQPVTDARLYSKQPKCVFEQDWIDVYFKLLDSHFPGIPFAKNPVSKPATETVEVVFPPNFPCAPPPAEKQSAMWPAEPYFEHWSPITCIRGRTTSLKPKIKTKLMKKLSTCAINISVPKFRIMLQRPPLPSVNAKLRIGRRNH